MKKLKKLWLELRIMKLGLRIGFSWVYGSDGLSSKTSAILASYHDPRKIMWRWALYWNKSKGKFSVWRHGTKQSSQGSMGFSIPFLGGLNYSWQLATV